MRLNPEISSGPERYQIALSQLALCQRVQCLLALIAWTAEKGRDAMSDEYEKAVGIGKKIADLQRQLDELKAQLPPEPFKPKFQMPRFDPTEGMKCP